jgi:hypothetical protein
MTPFILLSSQIIFLLFQLVSAGCEISASLVLGWWGGFEVGGILMTDRV